MRISDWSSDVCSSDLTLAHLTRPPVPKPVEHVVLNRQQAEEGDVPSSRLIIINTGDNLGYAGGNNVGMRMALRDPDIEYIWLLNNDTVVEPDAPAAVVRAFKRDRSEEHTSELQSLMRISSAVFCLKQK